MAKKEKDIEQVEPELMEDPVEEINEIDLLVEELTKMKDKFLRNQAELENFKRRTNEERIRERKFAQQYLLMKFVELMDNFERAVKQEYKSVKVLKEGLNVIMTQFHNILTEERVEKIEALHAEFDPNFHQAVMTSTEEGLEDDVVSEVFQTGYTYKERILRPSMVKVNKKGE